MNILIKYTRLFIISALLVGVVGLTYEIIRFSEVQQVRKYDWANINHMKYGLFNVNTWKEKLTKIFLSEIKDFKVTNSNKNLLKKHAQEQLNILIDKVDEHIRKNNKESTIGWLRQQFMEAFVDVDEIKEGIPTYADAMVKELTKEDSQLEFKALLKERIDKYVNKTFVKQDMSEVNSILERSGTKTKKEAMTVLKEQVNLGNQRLYRLTWVTIALAIGLFVVAGFRRTTTIKPYAFFSCMGVLICLLVAGVLCPMIDMDAEISNFSFSLFGYPVKFENQVVYFQSKSIIDVFFILIKDPSLQMKLVGVAMILFSIFFPLFKMISAIFYYYDIKGSQNNKFIRFFVLKSSKWSMTDVQIVAILMAYVGFNGMITSQFGTLRESLPKFILISTNGTVLQIGFFLFMVYVILALFFSTMIEMPARHKKKKESADSIV